MTPLQWPDFYQRPAPTPISWFAQLWHGSCHQCSQVTEHLKRELIARSRPDALVWGEDPLRIRMGLLACKHIQRNYEWPNDHFVPEDPFDILILLPWDDLEIVELVMALEADLDMTIADSEVEAWVGTRLGNVVDRLLALDKARMRPSSESEAR